MTDEDFIQLLLIQQQSEERERVNIMVRSILFFFSVFFGTFLFLFINHLI